MDNKNIPEEINPILPRLTSSEMANLYASAFKEKKMIFDDFNIKVDKISVAEQRKHMEKQLELLSQISNNTASLRDILDIAKEEKTVLIVSRDSDFTIKLFDQKIELNPYLKDECENLNINIIPFDDIDKAKHFYYNENNNIFEDNDNKIEDEDIAQVRNIIKCDHSNWHEEIQGRFCVNVCDKCGLGLYARLLSEDDLW